MSQALGAAAFGVLRLLWVAGWLWLEFQHTFTGENSILSQIDFIFLK